jgi:adenosylhomocysteine nucleosidase
LDAVPRTAVISAYAPEWQALRTELKDPKTYLIHRVTFITGTLAGKPVVLFLTGIGMVNAALSTQLAIDHFEVDRIVFSGIAGSVDPALSIGDVVVPAEWSEYLESIFARQQNDKYLLPNFAHQTLPNFQMIFPQPVEVPDGQAPPEHITWFHVDPRLLDTARTVAKSVLLAACTPKGECLANTPKIAIGGRGVSGSAFVDNRAFREYIQRAFEARSVDMESAAVAHVAYENDVPFIIFRSLSDLAGGDAGPNELRTFFQLAANNSAAFVAAFLKALP